MQWNMDFGLKILKRTSLLVDEIMKQRKRH